MAGQAQSVVRTLAAEILIVVMRDTATVGVKRDTATDVRIVIQRHEHGQRNNPPETDKYKY
jgi:hypothetical protein